MTSVERKLKRLSTKSWADLRNFWLSHIPEEGQLGQKPDETLEQHEILRQETRFVTNEGEHRFEPEASLAPQLFSEAVFIACKAIRVSCEAAAEVVGGLPTWSISTAHHSTLFALRAFLGLCGVAYLEIDGRYFLLDVRPREIKGRRGGVHRQLDTKAAQLIQVPQLGHRDWWKIYQRILHTSGEAFGCWPFGVDPALAACDVGTLSRHRNDVHYRLVWFFDDLFEARYVRSFGVFADEIGGNVVERLEDGDGSDGALILNQVLVGNCLAMLVDLARSSRGVKRLVDTVNSLVDRVTNDVVASWYGRVGPR